MGLAHGNRERMKFVEEMGLGFGGVSSECQTGEIGQCLIALAIADWGGRKEMVALGDAAQIFIGNRDGMTESIEQNRVGGLWANPGKSQQTDAQGLCGLGGEGFK
jgi:hypothetical protein